MTPAQAYLLKKAVETLKAAHLLYENQMYSDAVSRAYYAMFYAASAILLEKALSFSKHTAVLGAFGLHFVKTELIEQRFHQYLIQAEKLRSTADYAIEVVIVDIQAKEQLQNAEAFIVMATQFLMTATDTPDA